MSQRLGARVVIMLEPSADIDITEQPANGATPARRITAADLTPDAIDRFTRALCDDEAWAGSNARVWLQVLGNPSALYESLLAPAARRLGDWWESDAVCIATVALGMSTLQRMLWTFSRGDPPPPASGDQTPLLLAPVPGDQHTFGLNVLCEQVKARGGRPVLLACPTRPQLLAAARFGGYEAIGLSVGSEDALRLLPPLARALRAIAPAPLHILLGGPVVARLRPAASTLGVDEIIIEAPVERVCALLLQRGIARNSSAVAA